MSLQEIGPRFTLKLRSLRKGIPSVKNFGEAPKALEFDSGGEDEQMDDEKDETEKEREKVSSVEKVVPPKEDEFLWAWKVRLN